MTESTNAKLLTGAPVAKAINARITENIETLAQRGVKPTLAILRVGAREDDLSYERGALKKCEQLGVGVKQVILAADCAAEEVYGAIESLNQDPEVHGVLMFRPMPKHIDDRKVRQLLDPAKDVDGCTDGSLAGVFTNVPVGFPPCTARAAMEMLDYYEVPLSGANAVVIGRSLVVGRPAAMLLMHKNATPTICHTRTKNMPEITKRADVLVVCCGQAESIGAEYLAPGQTVIDVGINWSEEKGKLVGDVKFDEAEPVVAAISPVPRGVGSVTTSVLLLHVTEAALRQTEA